ncbi:protein phosphatase 1 regulatory subunit 42-like isoform X3 [Temnothorax curvispinosus]|uniref:Protein phosphatase 1 regulatory subunit 42-like isoform X3 n=1 Tax=Temnothorax curvispinosus TaxID=300111 RepID=A0A6J1R7T4_9HYME|nr:protein phosphatase 1 regulatory subunit 42-like isoform X3 [Temnothorax curvispinosus]
MKPCDHLYRPLVARSYSRSFHIYLAIMVKLTTDIVERKCSQILTSKSLSKTIKKDELWKLTHLHMNDMFISSIGNIAIYRSLKVLYLQNNNISKIKNLHFACNLTHLYLQHNAIMKMENLESLQNLQKLYLGHNNIIVVEGLQNTKKLQELHVENQKIPLGESLCFEPRSAFTLSMCVKVLNISDNKMTSLRNLIGFQELHTLDAKNNLVDNVDDVTTTISTLPSLKDLSLQGNPVTWSYRYKENLIANSVSLGSLNLPPAFKRSISRAIFQHPGPHLSITITPGSLSVGSQLQVFPPWKLASGIRSTKDNHITPRPFWGNINKSKETRLSRSHVNNKAIALPLI